MSKMAEPPFDARDERQFWERAGLLRPDSRVRFDRDRWENVRTTRSLPPRRPVFVWTAAVALLAFILLGTFALWHPLRVRHPAKKPGVSLVRNTLPDPSHIATARVAGQAASPPGIVHVDMLGPSQGFAVSPSHPTRLLSTTNGGVAWARLYQASSRIVQIAFVSPRTGFLLEGPCPTTGSSCMAQTLLQTRNGGHSWSRVHTFSQPVVALDAVTASDLWVLSDAMAARAPALLHSTNAGASWTAVADPVNTPPAFPEALSFINAHQGWLLVGQEPSAGSQGKTLYETQNGGTSWTLVSAASFGGSGSATIGKMPIGGYVQTRSGLVFVSAQRGYMALDRAGVFVTSDGGKDWRLLRQPANGADPAEVGFWSTTGGWLQEGFGASTGIPLYVTENGGSTWQRQYPAVVPTVVNRPAGQSFWLGFGDLWGNLSTRIQESTNRGRNWTTLARAPSGISHIQFLSRTAWVASGLGLGTLAITTDGGHTWRQVASPSPFFQVHTLTFANPQLGWVYVNQKGLYVTSDGGRHWTLRPVTALAFFPTNLVRTSSTVAYALGPTKRGRPTQKPIPGTQGKKTRMVTPSTPEYVWKSVNAGRTWVGTRIPSQHVEGLTFSGATGVVWSRQRYWVTEDGGARWTVQKWPSGWLIESLSVMGRKTLVVTVGSATSTTIAQYLSNNGGDTWDPFPTP